LKTHPGRLPGEKTKRCCEGGTDNGSSPVFQRGRNLGVENVKNEVQNKMIDLKKRVEARKESV